MEKRPRIRSYRSRKHSSDDSDEHDKYSSKRPRSRDKSKKGEKTWKHDRYNCESPKPTRRYARSDSDSECEVLLHKSKSASDFGSKSNKWYDHDDRRPTSSYRGSNRGRGRGTSNYPQHRERRDHDNRNSPENQRSRGYNDRHHKRSIGGNYSDDCSEDEYNRSMNRSRNRSNERQSKPERGRSYESRGRFRSDRNYGHDEHDDMRTLVQEPSSKNDDLNVKASHFYIIKFLKKFS